MKKYYFLIVLALILGLVLTGCLLSNVGQVPTTGQSGITYLTKTLPPPLFSDDFNDGNADGWTPVGSGGDWAVEDDADFGSTVYSQADTTWMTTSTYDTYWRSYGADSWTDYTFETKIKIVSGGFAPIAGIFFRVQGTDLDSGYYMFRIDARSIYGPALIKSPNTILEIDNTKPTVIGQIYALKVIVEGSNIKCYIDDEKIFDVMDSTYTTGRVGVGTFNAHTHFDDVLVRAIRAGWITINSDAPCTSSTEVTLNLSAYDVVGVTGYRVANGTDASSGTTIDVTSTTEFSADIPWTLPTGDGTKTVAVQYKDAVDNWSANYTDSIILDQTLPVVTINDPADGGFYPVGAVPALDYTVVDANSYTVDVSAYDNDVAGEKIVTVTATDCAGNEGSAFVTYYVLENFVTGGGKINMLNGKKAALTFGGTVGVLEGLGIVGQFQIVDHTGVYFKGAVSLHCSNFTYLEFSGVPAESPAATHNIATFEGNFTIKRGDIETVLLKLQIIDNGEPGAGVDTFCFCDPGCNPLTIDGGNFQVHNIDNED
jgi:hypothetical protein